MFDTYECMRRMSFRTTTFANFKKRANALFLLYNENYAIEGRCLFCSKGVTYDNFIIDMKNYISCIKKVISNIINDIGV